MRNEPNLRTTNYQPQTIYAKRTQFPEANVIFQGVDFFKVCGYTDYFLNACLASSEDLGVIKNSEDKNEST